MGAGAQADVAVALVGNGVAQRVDAVGLVPRVFRAFQHRHGLDNVGGSADDDVKAHVTQLLSHLLLGGVLRELVLLPPVQ